MPQYTTRRGGIFWFSRRAAGLHSGAPIPLGDRVAVVGNNGYVRFSLGTSERTQAAKLARKYAHLLDEAIERATQIVNPGPEAAIPSAAEVAKAAELMYAVLLDADEQIAKESLASLLSGGSTMDQEAPTPTADAAVVATEGDEWHRIAAAIFAEPDSPREPDRYQPISAALPPATIAGQAQLINELAGMATWYLQQAHDGKKFTVVGPELAPFADKYRLLITALDQRKAGHTVPTPKPPPPQTTWEEVLTGYLDGVEYAPKTVTQYQHAWTTLATHAGAPGELTKANVLAWIAALGGAPRTRHNRWRLARAIWRWGAGRDLYSASDPFDGTALRHVPGRDEPGGREQYTPAELETLFNPPPAPTQAASEHACYWLPLLALFGGARLLELTGLETSDMVETPYGLAMHIRPNNTRPRLKNKPSQRLIPVHPALLETGFTDYVTAAREAGVTQLWPGITTGAKFGEFYSKYARTTLKAPIGRIVGMHCFRHNWETARREARLDPAAANYLAGRTLERGSAAAYGTAAGLGVLSEELAKITYPNFTFPPAPAVTPVMLKNQAAARVRRMAGRRKADTTKAKISARRTRNNKLSKQNK